MHSHLTLFYSKGKTFFVFFRLLEDDSNPWYDLLVPGVLKFIGRAGKYDMPATDVVEKVIRISNSSANNLPLHTVALESLALIGCTHKGKAFLHTRIGKK